MNHLCPPADDLFSPKSRGLTIFNNLHVTHRDASKQVTRLLAWIKEWHALCRRKLILWEYISLLVVPKISRTILLVYDSLRSGVLCLFPPVLLILALCCFLGVVFSYGLPLRFSRSSLKIFHPSVFCCVPSHLSLLNSPSFFYFQLIEIRHQWQRQRHRLGSSFIFTSWNYVPVNDALRSPGAKF